jgi:hypothetical protein
VFFIDFSEKSAIILIESFPFTTSLTGVIMTLELARGANILLMVDAHRKTDKHYYKATSEALLYWSNELMKAPDEDLNRIQLCQTMRMRITCLMRAQEPGEPDSDSTAEDLGGLLTEFDQIPAEHGVRKRNRS